MKPAISSPGRYAIPLALGVFAAGTVPTSLAAPPAARRCTVPDVVGVNLGMARRAIASSGCSVLVRQLPAHGSFVTPASPDQRQIVASQSPRSGATASAVIVRLEPLCRQPAQPGPDPRAAGTKKGPTELIVGMFLRGGPLQTAPRCRRGTTSAGTLTVATPAGHVVAQHAVRQGRFAVFPLKPGAYVLSGVFAAGAHPPPQQVTIAAHRTTRLNLTADIP
jgi:hypothetical protein